VFFMLLAVVSWRLLHSTTTNTTSPPPPPPQPHHLFTHSQLIITAGGENVPPVLIENEMKAAMPAISNVMVIGDKKKFLSMVVSIKVLVEIALFPCCLHYTMSYFFLLPCPWCDQAEPLSSPLSLPFTPLHSSLFHNHTFSLPLLPHF
jgi:hypothetical protein